MAMGGVVILKNVISGPFKNAEQNEYLEILFGEMVGVGGGSLLTIKKVTSSFNFQSNEPFSKLLRLLRNEVPWSIKK